MLGEKEEFDKGTMAKEEHETQVSLMKATRPRVTAMASALIVGFWGRVATWQVFTRKLCVLTLKFGVRRFESLGSPEVRVEIDVLSAMGLRQGFQGGIKSEGTILMGTISALIKELETVSTFFPFCHTRIH